MFVSFRVSRNTLVTTVNAINIFYLPHLEQPEGVLTIQQVRFSPKITYRIIPFKPQLGAKGKLQNKKYQASLSLYGQK